MVMMYVRGREGGREGGREERRVHDDQASKL